MIAVGSLSATASALPVVDVFPLPGGNSTPVSVTVSEDGSLWFTDPGTEVVGRITPSGQLSLVPLPSPSGPTGIAVQGESVWFTLNDRGSLGRVPLQPPHAFEEFPLPAPAAQPFAIAAGLEGDIWFTEIGANQIGRRAADGTITEFAIPTELALPAGISVAADGGVWFTQFNRNQIGRLDPDGSIEERTLPNPGSGPFGIVAAVDGVWFTELNGNRIGHIDTEGLLREIDVPTTMSQPAGIAVGADGGIWFTQINADRIGRVLGNAIIEVSVGGGSFAAGSLFSGGISGGPGNRISFAASAAASIRSIGVCVDDSECASGNCDFSGDIGLCGPAHTPTPTNGVWPCLSDTSCPSGFFCNVEEGRLCCDMPVCPTGFTCRFPGREGFCTALPTPSRTPSATMAAPTTTPTPLPTATASVALPTAPSPTATLSLPTSTPVGGTPSMTATATPTSSGGNGGGGGGGGCDINPRATDGSSPAWAVLALLPLLLARSRAVRASLRVLALATCAASFACPQPATAQLGGTGEEPTSTATVPPTHTPTPTSTATASSTRAATATPHLIEIRIGSAVAGPGDAAHIAVSVESTNTQVAAIANEIVFPSDILSLDAKNCFLRPGIDKSLRADPVSDAEGIATMRVVVQSSRNVDPIPNGVLYTCTFLLSPLALPGTYAVESGLTVGFAADGGEIRNVRGSSGEVTVSLIGEPCTGDCDGGGDVTVDEIVAGVSIALGTEAMGACPRLDSDASGDVTVDELVLTVNNALNGCTLPPPPRPTATPTTAPLRTPLFVRASGNDADSGLTPARALRTISQAARIVPSGYRIVVGPGLYVEGVTTDGQGRAPENVVFEADVSGSQTGDPAGAVVIDATGSVVAAGFRLTSSSRTVIDGFTITGAVDGGIVIKSGSDDFVIRNCTLFANPGAGIRVQDSARVQVFNNLVYDNGREGIAIVGQGSGSPDARVFNNTVYGNADRALRVGTSQDGSPGALVTNNIFQGNGVGFVPPLENVKVFPSSEPGYDADFNLVFPPTYLPFDIVGEHDIAFDALFVAAGDEDFRLAFESPAIDAGGPLTDDLEARLSARTTTAANLDDGPLDLGFHFPP